jgi:hypothetical protein
VCRRRRDGSSGPNLAATIALGPDRRRVDHLDLLHRADVARAERGHRLAECPDEVLAAVRDVGRPNRMRSIEPTVPTRMRVPRGSVGDGAAMPQFVPPPGASSARASGDRSLSTSAPPRWLSRVRRPGACRRRRRRARTACGIEIRVARGATSEMAVTWGHRLPSTSRVVHAATRRPHEDRRDACSISWYAASKTWC